MSLLKHVGALYEGLDDPAAIRSFLEQARKTYRASNVGFMWIDRIVGESHYINVGIPDDMQADYVARLDRDPWVVAGLDRRQSNFVASSADLVPWTEYRRSRFFDDFVRPLGTRHMICGAIVNRRYVAALSFHRSVCGGEFGSRTRCALEELNGHIDRVGHFIWQESQWRSARMLSVPVVEISRCGVEYFNDEAATWLKGNKHLATCTSQRFRLRDPACDARLHGLCGAILDNRWNDLPVGEVTMPLGRSGRLLILPAKVRSANLAPIPIAQLIILDSDDSVLEGCIARIGLTAAEAAIVRALVSGRTLNEFALESGKSIQTVRSQVKQIFEKTGCNSQIGLIAKMTARTD